VTNKRTSTRKPRIKAVALNAAASPVHRWSRGRAERVPLLIDELRPDETADRLRDILAQHGELYDNGAWVPVRIHTGRYGKSAQLATKTIIVREAHKVCQPLELTPDGLAPTRLKADLAQHYLEHEKLGLRPLNGIVTTPMLQGDGTISKPDGYDAASGMFCYAVPDLTGMVPAQPTRASPALAPEDIPHLSFRGCWPGRDS
jgi:hypothetical protein